VLIISSGRVLSVLATTWIDDSPVLGRRLVLDPACVCVLGYDHDGLDRAIRLWN
jgi:hypothetical protein